MNLWRWPRRPDLFFGNVVLISSFLFLILGGLGASICVFVLRNPGGFWLGGIWEEFDIGLVCLSAAVFCFRFLFLGAMNGEG